MDRMFKKVMTRENHLSDELIWVLASAGDSAQDKCQWASLRVIAPSTVDNGLAASASVTDATAVDPQQEAILKTASMFLQIKNSANHRVDITVYKLYPRINMPAAFVDINGINPAYLQAAFAARDLVSNTGSRLAPYDEHGADPYMSSLPKTMRIKKVLRKYLEPGGFFSIKHTIRNQLFSKAKLGVQSVGGTLASAWDWFKQCGPLYLIRAQGPQVHDESKFTLPVTSSTTGPATYGTTMGGFAVQIYGKFDYHWVCCPYPNTYPKYGTLTNALPANITAANEATWEVRVPQEDQIGV